MLNCSRPSILNPVRWVFDPKLPTSRADQARVQLKVERVLTACEAYVNTVARLPIRRLFVEGSWNDKTATQGFRFNELSMKTQAQLPLVTADRLSVNRKCHRNEIPTLRSLRCRANPHDRQ